LKGGESEDLPTYTKERLSGIKAASGLGYSPLYLLFVATPEACPYTMKRTGFFVLALWGCFGLAKAQHADTLQLLPVEVEASRATFHTGYRTLMPDSLLVRQLPGANLSDLLERQGSLTLRTYGMGSLSTSAARGAGSAHTAVLWDGFSLLSPMNGLSDLALLPLFFVDDSRVQQGASVAMFGSGAMGSAIQLGQSVPQQSKVSLFYEGGSFGQHTAGAQLSRKWRQTHHDIRFFHKQARNNFPYSNTARFGAPTEKLSNASLDARGLIYQFGWRINRKDSLSVKGWYQQYSRQIPPAMTAAQSVSVQDDQALRAQWRWLHTEGKAEWEFRQLWLLESNVFEDSLADLFEDHRFVGMISEAAVKRPLTEHWQAQLVVNHTHYQAFSPAFDTLQPPKQNRFAFWLAARYAGTRWRLQLLARQEVFAGQLVPFTPGIGSEYQLTAQSLLYMNASRLFRLPTLNDLHWQPGGNPDLRPELGISAEAGIRQIFVVAGKRQEVSMGYFRQRINDWIIWLPGTAGYWVPENLLSVASQGLEFNAKLQYALRGHRFRLHADYAWVKSVHKEVGPGQENRLNKQLIYVPEHQLRAQLWYEYGPFYAGVLYNFTGQRFVTSDHSSQLDPYQLNHLQTGVSRNIRKADIRLGLQVNNLFNTRYQAVQWRPMPGRYYLLNLTITFLS